MYSFTHSTSIYQLFHCLLGMTFTIPNIVIVCDFMDNFYFYSFLNGLLVTYLQLHFIRYHTSKTFQNMILILGDC